MRLGPDVRIMRFKPQHCEDWPTSSTSNLSKRRIGLANRPWQSRKWELRETSLPPNGLALYREGFFAGMALLPPKFLLICARILVANPKVRVDQSARLPEMADVVQIFVHVPTGCLVRDASECGSRRR